MRPADRSEASDEEHPLLAETDVDVSDGGTNDAVSLCLREPVVGWVCKHDIVDAFVWYFKFFHDDTDLWVADEMTSGLFHLKW